MSDFWRARVIWLVISVVVLLLYWQGVDGPFVYDDKVEVIGNRTIRATGDWRSVLGYNVSRALLVATYAANFHWFAFDPHGYHLTNIAVQIGAIGAALWMAEAVGRLGGARAPGWVAGLVVGLWAVHPMLTEAVQYTTGRSESLCGLFVFVALAAWAQALGTTGGPRWGWRLGALLACVAAFFTKEVAGMLPLALFAMEWLLPKQEGPRWRRIGWGWYLPFGVLVGLAAWFRLSTGAGELLPNEVERTMAVQLTSSAEVWLRYLGLWILPIGQTLFHGQSEVDPGTLRGGMAWLGLMALVGAAVWAAWRRPLVAFGLLCAAAFLIPSSSFVSLKELMAEHRAYQTGLYLGLALAWGLPDRWRPRAAMVAGLVAIPLVGASWARIQVWNSEISLWEEATAATPDSAEAMYGLGDAFRFGARFTEAAASYERCVELDPDHLDAWNNLGITHATMGSLDRAAAAWKSALKSSPSYCKAHNNLGMLALQTGDLDSAEGAFRSSLAYCQDDILAHYGLGTTYYQARQHPDRALVHFETVLKIDPAFSKAEEVKERIFQLTF